jgi:UDP-glucuronate decarboxylase
MKAPIYKIALKMRYTLGTLKNHKIGQRVMHILLTGVSGFLGSNLAGALIESGHKITGIDNFRTGSLINIDNLVNHENFELLSLDIRDEFDIPNDLTVNMACPASPIQYQLDPIYTLETNFIGMSNVLKNATKYGSRVIQASTSEIYGNPQITPQDEHYFGNVNPIGPRSCYDEGKRVAETLCSDYYKKYKTKTQIIRIFNTYGPNMAINDGRVVSNFIVQALRNEPITIYGKGLQTRSFCYVTDLIGGISRIIESHVFESSPINIGNPVETTMIELAEIVIKLTNSNSKIKFETLPIDDPEHRLPNINKIRRLHHWEPKIDLETGVRQTIDYFTKIIGNK